MKVSNAAIPKSDVAEVQMHLDALNTILPKPPLTQIDVLVTFSAGQAVYTLEQSAEARVTAKLDWLVSHETNIKPGRPSIAPSVEAARVYFNIPMPVDDGGALSTDDGIPRP